MNIMTITSHSNLWQSGNQIIMILDNSLIPSEDQKLGLELHSVWYNKIDRIQKFEGEYLVSFNQNPEVMAIDEFKRTFEYFTGL